MKFNPLNAFAKFLSDGNLSFYVFGLALLILFMVFGRDLIFG